MKLLCKKSALHGKIRIPASKSHVIRALAIASLAEGVSKIIEPLYSDDSNACVDGCRAFGAKVKQKEHLWEVTGFGRKPKTPKKEVNLGNSGISTNYLAGIAAFAKGPLVITGGHSLLARPFGPICKGINDLGGKAESFNGTGKPPLKISGTLKGGFTKIDGLSSQPVSSFLVSCAVAENDSEIIVSNPHETSYIEMTMKWLDEQCIRYKASSSFEKFTVFGGQEYKAFEKAIPADWSSACFPLCAAAITPNSKVLLKGLDFNDLQGDKEVVNMLKKMGANIQLSRNSVKFT